MASHGKMVGCGRRDGQTRSGPDTDTRVNDNVKMKNDCLPIYGRDYEMNRSSYSSVNWGKCFLVVVCLEFCFSRFCMFLSTVFFRILVVIIFIERQKRFGSIWILLRLFVFQNITFSLFVGGRYKQCLA